jgi:hypothetical protein
MKTILVFIGGALAGIWGYKEYNRRKKACGCSGLDCAGCKSKAAPAATTAPAAAGTVASIAVGEKVGPQGTTDTTAAKTLNANGQKSFSLFSRRIVSPTALILD